MPKQVTTREVLQELAAKPIGSRELQQEARRVAHMEKPKVSAELKETIKRTSKIWLPSGKRSMRAPEVVAERETFNARQIDLEDAVEQAGGKRGSVNS